ncbi:phage holin family protein [Frigidibacter sp. ROC022]|uniref:phage holin family protein n=1 Tax=Frigidibacter sp. ROC022 TaxID=2971796 RepID=UPI00215AF305|nr:phage holin family protein [Frigidibacter sp. ROC022]MCR8723858.1 phage holin family protein [Frigidibacter sp. ROC022]
MFGALRASAADIARRSALGVAAAILLIVALGFITSAGWYALKQWDGPVTAGLIVGGIYLVLGLVLMLLAREPAPPPPPPQEEVPPMQRVVAAFFDGIEAGSRARRPPPDDPSRRR